MTMKATKFALKLGQMVGPNAISEKQRGQFDRLGHLVGGSLTGSIVEEISTGEIKVDIIRQGTRMRFLVVRIPELGRRLFNVLRFTS